MEKAAFVLTEARSFTSQLTGRMRQGETKILPILAAKALPPVFTVRRLGEHIEWPVCLEGGIGDKIYALPSLYVYPGKVGVGLRDERLYRAVSDKTRPRNGGDLNLFVQIGDPETELTDQIAERLGVENELGLRLPVLHTTPEEKEKVKDDRGYAVLALWATNPVRSWSAGRVIEQAITDRPVRTVTKRSPELIPMVERADCVISVNTSLLPMAGGVQVPIVSVDAPNRTRDFLDVVECEKTVDSVLAAYEALMARKRLRCWCGAVSGSVSVTQDIYLIRCSSCGTVRQDVKLSEDGLAEFYKEHYHNGWRELVEGQQPYEKSLAADRVVAEKRLMQWGLQAKGKRWVEVGSGSGALLDVLSEKGADACGVEPDGAICPGVPLVAKQAVNGCDRIVYVDVLEHLMDPLGELRWARSHLRNGGKVVIEVPLAEEEPRHYRRLQHLFFFTPESLKIVAAKAGMQMLREVHPMSGRYSMVLEAR